MKITNELAQKLYGLDKKDIANFIALFSTLDINDEYSSTFGKIKKTGEDTFTVSVSSKNYEKILEELTNNEDNIHDIFST